MNAANEKLFAAGYESLTASCQQLGSCPTGSAVITPAHGFPAERAAEIAVRTCSERDGYLDETVLVGFDVESAEVLNRLMRRQRLPGRVLPYSSLWVKLRGHTEGIAWRTGQNSPIQIASRRRLCGQSWLRTTGWKYMRLMH